MTTISTYQNYVKSHTWRAIVRERVRANVVVNDRMWHSWDHVSTYCRHNWDVSLVCVFPQPHVIDRSTTLRKCTYLFGRTYDSASQARRSINISTFESWTITKGKICSSWKIVVHQQQQQQQYDATRAYRNRLCARSPHPIVHKEKHTGKA